MAVPHEFCSIKMTRGNPPENGADVEDGKAGARLPHSKLLLGGCGLASFDFGSGVGVLLGEALDTAGGVNQLLLAGEEGMAARADFDVQLFALDGRTSL